MPYATDDVSLQLLFVTRRLWFYEERRRWPPVANYNARINEISAGCEDIVLDRLRIAAQRVLRLDPVIVSASENITLGLHFQEEVSGVVVTVGMAESRVGTVTGICTDDELEQVGACVRVRMCRGNLSL